ncbi:MAG: tyrosine-type recombinase/integrase [Ahrensia sp.]|nr:tyrosine-type recombinase/integrase [Ahrensia sp.]
MQRSLKNPGTPTSALSPPEADNPAAIDAENGQRPHSDTALALPDTIAGSGSLDALVDTARDYVRHAKAENTQKAYATDWADYTSWCRRCGVATAPPTPETVALYLAHLAAPAKGSGQLALAVSTIERRLAGLCWTFAQNGTPLDRKDRHIAGVMAGIRRKHGTPPEGKEPVLAEDILAMIDTLDHSLRGLRDRAILLVGFAGGLRRSEITGLDVAKGDTEEGRGWVEFYDEGLVLSIKTKTGWREPVVGRGSSERSCPVAALETWMHYGRIAKGPLFRRVLRADGRGGSISVGADRLSDKHVARLIKRTVMKAGIRSDIAMADREERFSGHSLRAGFASGDVDERFVQKQLGHSTVAMTRTYQRRRDRFRNNLTRASGL